MYRLLGTLVLAYGLVVLMVWLMQESLLFPGSHSRSDQRVSTLTDPYQVIELRDQGANSAMILAKSDADRVVLMTHGNGEWIGDLDMYRQELAREGWGFAAVEYRGFADIEGKPIEQDLVVDVRAAYQALLAHGYTTDRIILHGRSIGGGVGTVGLAGHKLAGVVLESSFDSLIATAKGHALGRIVPLGLLMRSPLRSIDALKTIDAPVFIAHDLEDPVVHFERAANLVASLGERAQLVTTEGQPHGAAITLFHPQVRPAYFSFLEQRVPRRPQPPSTAGKGLTQ